MCRLLGVVTASPMTLADALNQDLPAFTALAKEHCHGWGTALSLPQKNTAEVTVEADSAATSPVFANKAITTEFESAIVHFRKASPGLAINIENAHPFQRGTASFAHNGWAYPEQRLYDMVQQQNAGTLVGSTDSEAYFLLIQQQLNSGLSELEAVAKVALDIAEQCKFVALNCTLQTPAGMAILQLVDPAETLVKNFVPAKFTLLLQQREDAVIVASNTWDYDSALWQELANGDMLWVPAHRPNALERTSIAAIDPRGAQLLSSLNV